MHTETHSSWQSMIQRCCNPKNQRWEYYGGRGIQVCGRWRWSHENFLEDMGERPSGNYSLDRYPDNEGHYEPGNCRWATYREQNNNRVPRRSSPDVRTITFRGETLTIREWADLLGLTIASLVRRFYNGWEIEEALTVPAQTPIDLRFWYREKRGKAGFLAVLDPLPTNDPSRMVVPLSKPKAGLSTVGRSQLRHGPGALLKLISEIVVKD